MKEILLPLWIFDHPGEYFLVGIEPDGRVRVDGGHSKPSGVATAKHLHESIEVIKPPNGTKFVMVKVDCVPDFRGSVNQDAIDILNKVKP